MRVPCLLTTLQALATRNSYNLNDIVPVWLNRFLVNLPMCQQLVEVYSNCRCLYYQHAVQRCPIYRHHRPTQSVMLVGFACAVHSGSSSVPARAARDVADGEARASQEKSFDKGDKKKKPGGSTRWTISENQTDDRTVCRARYLAFTRGRVSKLSSPQSSRSPFQNSARGRSNIITRKAGDGVRPKARPLPGSGAAPSSLRPPQPPASLPPPQFSPVPS